MRSKRKLSVSVGIPAYNEETNIGYLLHSVVEQKEQGFELKEIIVVSDGSTDRTVEEVGKLDEKRIKVIKGKKRKGQALRQNQIFKMAKGDFLVLLNADSLIKSDSFLFEMLGSYRDKENVGLVVARATPMESHSFFGKIITWHANWKRQLFEQINHADNIYLCNGLARGFPKDVYCDLRWPQSWAEDAYSYLSIKKRELKFIYCRNAQVYYRPPQNFKDHVRQSIRFIQSKDALAPFFKKKQLRTAYAIPPRQFLTFSLKGFLENPLKGTAYACIYLYCKSLTCFKALGPNYQYWDISTTTKKLIPETD